MLIFWVICLVVEVAVVILFRVPATRSAMLRLNNNTLFINIISLTIRVGIAGMFLAACYGKILSPYGFAELVAQYQFLPSSTVNFFSLWLPIFELILALGFVFTKWTKEFTFMILVLFIMFIIALTQALIRDLGITCGCFDIEGAQDKTGAWVSLLRDIVIVPILIWLYKKGSNKFLWNFKKAA